MDKEGKNIAIRSDEVQEIMSEIPNSIIRWGITVILAILVIFLAGCYFFKYPDVINAEITVTAVRPPAVIMARATGKIEKLYVVNQQIVDSGMPLAVIENPANAEDMQLLAKFLEIWKSQDSDPAAGKLFFSQKTMRLGSVQTSYSEFLNAIQNYAEFTKVEYYPQKISIEESQLKFRESHLLEMLKQRKLLKMQLETTMRVYRRDSLLYKKGVSSEEDFESSRSKMLQARLSLSALEAQVKEVDIEISQTKESILDLHQENMEYENKYLLDLNSSYEKLLAQVKTWEKEYLLVSTVKGQINLMGNWSENQNVQIGETLFTVLPVGDNTPLGKALLPVLGSGKVKTGQTVHVRLNNYPDQEFGYIDGLVRNVSAVPLPDGNYVAEISFPKGLKTNYSVEIPATGTLLGTAEIITEDIRLLKRIIMPVRRVLKKHF